MQRRAELCRVGGRSVLTSGRRGVFPSGNIWAAANTAVLYSLRGDLNIWIQIFKSSLMLSGLGDCFNTVKPCAMVGSFNIKSQRFAATIGSRTVANIMKQ